MGNAADQAILDALAWDDNPDMSVFRQEQDALFATKTAAPHCEGEANQ